MNKIFSKLRYILEKLNKIIRYFATFSLIYIFLALIAQVFARSLFPGRISMFWVTESTSFMHIWMIFLGAAYVSWENKHIAMTLFQKYIPNRLNKIFVTSITLLTCVLVIFQTYKLVLRQWYIPYVGAPFLTRGYGSIAILITFCLIFIYRAIDLYDIFSRWILNK